MKALPVIIAAILLTFACSGRAQTIYLKANVTGTIRTQFGAAASSARIRTAILNNKRIFSEFGVSKNDYELVVDINDAVGLLVLTPKHFNGGLPVIKILEFGSHHQIIVDSKLGIEGINGDFATGTATNLFMNLAGEIDGTFHFRGDIVNPTFTKAVLTSIAQGTDTSGLGNGSAFLKFKVVAAGAFHQVP